ncbi:MAG: hypothetical protein ABJ333_12835 [Algoriphagus sp.]|uniref:hypothetical protein n=1 Tax=Algoriphagus sp. TaxID=1872435 RepID=UPI0032991FE0
MLEESAEFSNWLFVQSDKALQVRYREDSRQNGVGSFTVEFRIAFDDKIYCSLSDCLGYYLTFAYPTLDNQTSVRSFFKFYNSFRGVYTLPNPMLLKMEFSDGSKRVLKENGFYYSEAGSENLFFAGMLFSSCVDNILASSDYSRCNSGHRAGEFQMANAIVIN